jgi:hypothetical protein
MAVILSGANGSLYFACGVYGTSGKIQGFFPFGFAQGQNDDRRIYLNENGHRRHPPVLRKEVSLRPVELLDSLQAISHPSVLRKNVPF